MSENTNDPSAGPIENKLEIAVPAMELDLLTEKLNSAKTGVSALSEEFLSMDTILNSVFSKHPILDFFAQATLAASAFHDSHSAAMKEGITQTGGLQVQLDRLINEQYKEQIYQNQKKSYEKNVSEYTANRTRLMSHQEQLGNLELSDALNTVDADEKKGKLLKIRDRLDLEHKTNFAGKSKQDLYNEQDEQVKIGKELQSKSEAAMREGRSHKEIERIKNQLAEVERKKEELGVQISEFDANQSKRRNIEDQIKKIDQEKEETMKTAEEVHDQTLDNGGPSVAAVSSTSSRSIESGSTQAMELQSRQFSGMNRELLEQSKRQSNSLEQIQTNTKNMAGKGNVEESVFTVRLNDR